MMFGKHMFWAEKFNRIIHFLTLEAISNAKAISSLVTWCNKT